MLNALTLKKDIRTFSVSPENLTGEKGKGGMATEGTGSDASRELGQGWKVNPYLKCGPGETVVLADIKGQGAIKHFWITDSSKAGRHLISFCGYSLTGTEILRWKHRFPIFLQTQNIRNTVSFPVLLCASILQEA